MAIDWDDNTKRKAFREVLQKVYPSDAELAMFVDEELNINLATIAGGANLQVTAHGLVTWARAQGRLDEVYEAFKAQHPKHPVIQRLEQPSFVICTSNLTQNDWDMLFGLFVPDDLADLKRAFGQGFCAALGLHFQQAQPKHPPIIEIAQIRELLEGYDTGTKGPQLAVRFVEYAIAQIRRSSEESNREESNRDLTALEQWRDRIAQQYNVSPESPEPVTTVACHAYLLVALKEMGSQVNVYPELHITGADNPIPFGATPKTCAVSQVAAHVSEWIKKAESTEAIQRCEETQVTLEIFLPRTLLEEDIATEWKIKNEWGDERDLETYRRFLVRSIERLLYPSFKNALIKKWNLLEKAVDAGDGYSKFHRQDNYEEGLSALLDDLNATGLKLTAKLPSDHRKRNDVFKEIIEAAIPIALWSSGAIDTDADTLNQEFDALLDQVLLTNFAELAKRWRMRRRDSTLAKHIRLLCDCPRRFPKLPHSEQENDSLVSPF